MSSLGTALVYLVKNVKLFYIYLIKCIFDSNFVRVAKSREMVTRSSKNITTYSQSI